MSAHKSNHARSSSAPSLPHPLFIKATENLHKIKTCIHGSPHSFSTICGFLRDLAELFESVHLLIRLPSLHHLLSQPLQKPWLEAQLECSLQLLDVEAPMIDYLASVKAFVFDLQSALRRRGDKAHVCSRRKAQKEAVSCSKLMKKMEERFVFAALVEKNGDLAMLDGLMREAREIAAVVLQLLVSLVEIPGRRKDWGGRILVLPKAMRRRRGGFGLELPLSTAFERVSGGGDGLEDLEEKAREELNQVESGIGGLEIGLQCLFRGMIQNRVVLLNMLSF